MTSALPLIEQPLMATANGRVEGVLVRGMRVEDIRANQTINGNVVAGDIAVGHAGQRQGRDRLAAGRDARRLSGQPDHADQPGRPLDRRSAPCRAIVTYTVGAIFEVGVYDYDKAFVLMPMQDAQTLLMMGDEVGMVEVQTTDPDKVERDPRAARSRWSRARASSSTGGR